MYRLLFLALLSTLTHCKEYMLPGDVVPHHYDVVITHDIDPATNFSYFGVVDILISAKEAVSKIVLHSESYHVSNNDIRVQGPNEPNVKEVKLNDTYNLLTIHLDRELETGENYTLRIPFYGNLKTGLDGTYISSYVDKKNQTTDIPLDLRPEVYCVGIARGSARHWRFLLARRQRTDVASARSTTLTALACSRDVWILYQYLEWTIIDNPEVRRQDAPVVLYNIIENSVGYYVAKDFIYNRIEEIDKAFSGSGRAIGFIVNAILNQFTTKRELDEFMSWYEYNTKYLSRSTQSISQGIEKAKVNLDWVNNNKKLVVDKLREFSM